jgi:hypothetical protein
MSVSSPHLHLPTSPTTLPTSPTSPTLPTSPYPPHPPRLPHPPHLITQRRLLLPHLCKRYCDVTFEADYRLTTLYISNCVCFRLFLSCLSPARSFPSRILPSRLFLSRLFLSHLLPVTCQSILHAQDRVWISAKPAQGVTKKRVGQSFVSAGRRRV